MEIKTFSADTIQIYNLKLHKMKKLLLIILAILALSLTACFEPVEQDVDENGEDVQDIDTGEENDSEEQDDDYSEEEYYYEYDWEGIDAVGFDVYDSDDNHVLSFSIDDVNEWSEENWDNFDETPQVWMRDIQAGSFTFFDDNLKINKDKIFFSVHDYAVASYTSFVGVVDIPSWEFDILMEPIRWSIWWFAANEDNTYLWFVQSTGRAARDFMTVVDLENMEKSFELSEEDILPHLDPDNLIVEEGQFMPEFWDLSWWGDGQTLKFQTSFITDDLEYIEWEIDYSWDNLTKLTEVSEDIIEDNLETVEVYFMQVVDGMEETVALSRTIYPQLWLEHSTLQALLDWLSEEEQEEWYSTTIDENTRIQSFDIQDWVVKVDFSADLEPDGGSAMVMWIISQIEKTLTQFDSIDSVEISIDWETEEILQP